MARTGRSSATWMAESGSVSFKPVPARGRQGVWEWEWEGEAASPRVGFMKGEIEVPADFDTMGSQEIEDMFHGSPSDSG